MSENKRWTVERRSNEKYYLVSPSGYVGDSHDSLEIALDRMKRLNKPYETEKEYNETKLMEKYE